MGYKVWPPRFLLKGTIRSPHGTFGHGRTLGGPTEPGYGAELVTNGDFTVGTGWTTDTGWAIGSGVATATATAAAAYLHRAVTVTVGKTYRLVYTVTAYTSGNVQGSFDNGQTFSVPAAATGTYTDWITVSSAVTEIRFGRASSDFTGSIDNVSLKQAGP